MKRSLHHLTVLLLGLLVWAAADDAQEHSCDASTLAMRMAHFCFSDRASASCCEAVIDSMDICGAVPYLCHVCEELTIV